MSRIPLVVAMGTSGVGKSVVGLALAQCLGVAYADGDDFHPSANRLKMSTGTSLTDDDRWPWLDEIGGWLADHSVSGGVVSCSALRRAYRRVLVDAAPSTCFLHLVADHEVVRARMEVRDHFMPPALLDSQERTLEPLQDDEIGWTLEARGAPDVIARHFIELAGFAGHT